MNLSIWGGWCGRKRARATAAAPVVDEPPLVERVAIQEAERLRVRVEVLQRMLEAEAAENERLVAKLNRSGIVERDAGPLSTAESAYWRAEAERHRANATRLDDRLAAAEGRPVHRAARP